MHADYMILTPKIEKSPYRGRGDTLPPLGRFAPSGLVAPLPRIFPYKLETIPPPHTFEDLSTPLLII